MALTSNRTWGGGAFSLGKLREMIDLMPPRMDGHFGPSLYRDIMRGAEPPKEPILPTLSAFGIPIIESRLFPIQSACHKCAGTGEGEESTYCRHCKGAGETRIEGVMRQGNQTILFTATLAKKFAPSFPRGFVRQPPISRGLA